MSESTWRPAPGGRYAFLQISKDGNQRCICHAAQTDTYAALTDTVSKQLQVQMSDCHQLVTSQACKGRQQTFHICCMSCPLDPTPAPRNLPLRRRWRILRMRWIRRTSSLEAVGMCTEGLVTASTVCTSTLFRGLQPRRNGDFLICQAEPNAEREKDDLISGLAV